MTYLLKNKPKRDFKKIILPILIFLILTAFVFFAPAFSRNVSYTLARPVWYFGNTFSGTISKVKDFFNFKNNLINENNSLKDQIDALKLKVIDYDNLIKENDELKNQFGRSGSSKKVLAAVLSRPPLSPYDTLVIDAGSNSGVTSGDKVYLSENIIIGFITSVTSKTSLVRLFSSGGSKQQAILNRTGASFELVGTGGANMKLEVPKDTDVVAEDSFSYPGISESAMGSVYYIDTNSQSSFKTVYVRSPSNVFQSKLLFVEKI